MRLLQIVNIKSTIKYAFVWLKCGNAFKPMLSMVMTWRSIGVEREKEIKYQIARLSIKKQSAKNYYTQNLNAKSFAQRFKKRPC